MKNETEKICTGCGRSSLNPIEEQYTACCPDNNYVIMSNKTKQTSVEWLVKQLPLIQQEGLRDVIEEAKAQERWQSIRILTKYHNSLFLLPLKDGEAESIYNHIVDTNKMVTAVEWLVEQMKLDELFNADYFIDQAKEMEKEQIGYTKQDVLTAGEMGEINTYDTKHIVSYLDEAKQLNETYGGNK